jgi:MFS transporter, DHA1 family, tetracycline resistance protein
MSDRYGRRRVLLWSLASTALLGGLTAFCVTPWSLIVMRLFAGFAAASFGVTFAVASDVSTPRERAGAMARVGAGLSLGFILGPALGGLMAGATAEAADFARICYASAGLSALAFAAALWLLPETTPPRAATAAPVRATGMPRVRGGVSVLLRDPNVARLMVVSLLTAAAAAMMESNFALFASARFAAGPRTIGFVFGAMGIMSTILQLAGAGWASRRFGDERVMQVGILLQGAGLGMLAAATSFALAVGGMMMISIGFAFLSPALSSLTSLAGPQAAQGEVLGLQQASGAFGRVLGPGTSGPIYDGFGPNAPFFAGAVAMFVTLAYARLTRARRDAGLR